MATRSHIRFEDGKKKFQLFKFHDGYPDTMIPHFKEFFKLLRNHEFDEIIPAYITYAKLEAHESKTIEEYQKNEWKPICLEVYLTEVTNDLPSDIEYFYIIDLKKEIIKEKYTKQTWKFEELKA